MLRPCRRNLRIWSALAALITLLSPLTASAGTVCTVDAFRAWQVAIKRGWSFYCKPALGNVTVVFTAVPGSGLMCAAKGAPLLPGAAFGAFFFKPHAAGRPVLKGGWNLRAFEIEGGQHEVPGLSDGADGLYKKQSLVHYSFSVKARSSPTRRMRTVKLESAGNGLNCDNAINQAF